MTGAGGFTTGTPKGPHYEIEVNKGSINVAKFQSIANQRFQNGYLLQQAYEQDGNTVVIWERYQ
jgi:hypothetical protein